MASTIEIITTALASGVGASAATYLFQSYFDRRLEYYFNSRLEELKSNLSIQGEAKNQIESRRLELYPSITELVYRLRNQLKEIRKARQLPMDQAINFIRLAEQYSEKIYSARLYLEVDEIFELLHNFKSHILIAKNLLLDWIYLARDEQTGKDVRVDGIVNQLDEVYKHLDRQHQRLIRSLTKLTQG